METLQETQYTAFEGLRRIARGPLPEVALQVKQVLERGEREPVLVFDDTSSQVVDLDLRGTSEDILGRLPKDGQAATPDAAALPPNDQARRPGRPKLGVVAREVTLLPRHWEWLSRQPGGASVALRKLVDEARKVNQTKDKQRRARESAYRFAVTMAGNEAGFEEALRALFAGNQARFEETTATWPIDVRDHARNLAAPAWGT